MHRKVKGLLSLILACVMVIAAVNPVLADELPTEQTTGKTVSVEPESSEKAESEAVEESETTQAESTKETEQPESEFENTETEVPVRSQEITASADEEWESLYNALPESYKGFRVYIGETTLTQLLEEQGADISTVLKTGMMEEELMIGSADLVAQGGRITKTALDNREGDAKFYRWFKWNVWKVNSDGLPEDLAVSEDSNLDRVATKDNFKSAAHLENWGTGENPSIICQKPIVEPVFECIDYPIPIYDKDGNDTGEKFTINAENYNSIPFPTGIEADYWKLIYNGIEYQLTAPSDVWTNEANGIRMTGKWFAETEAKLQAGIRKYEISGEQGNEGWYKGAVTLRAKDGYQIRLSETDAWTDAVTIEQSGSVSLYVKKADGTEFPAETLQFLIDAADPVITGVQNGHTYYADEVAVVVTDEHLRIVTLNGGEVGISDNKAYITLRPSENPYIIMAEDMAGNWGETIVWVKEKQPTEHPSEEPTTEAPEEPTTEVLTEPPTEHPSEEPTTEAPEEPSTEPTSETPEESSTEPTTEVPEEPSTETPDKTAPVINGVSDGGIYYGAQKVTVTDENLRKVTVNGEAMAVSAHRAEFEIKSSDDDYKFVIAAEDEAGNRTKYTIEVWETWVRDGIVTNGKKLLRRERIYKLGKGKWTVSGDSTVYQGGGTFYVKKGGTYNFKKK